MNRSGFLVVSLAAFALMSAKPVLSFEVYMTHGQDAFRKGDYPKARQLFETELKLAPRNASAHYMLGQIYCRTNHRDEAIREFTAAVSLDRTGVAGQYSQKALAAFGITEKVPAPTAVPDKSPEADTSSSVKTISSQTSERQSVLQTECDTRVERILHDAEEEAKKISKDADERIAANGQPTFRLNRYGAPTGDILYDPAPVNEEIKADVVARVAKLKKDAQDKADALIKSYKERQSSLDSAAMRLENTYASGNRLGDGTSIVPKGTTIYTRHYQTSDEPSGVPVPVRATPAGRLPQK